LWTLDKVIRFVSFFFEPSPVARLLVRPRLLSSSLDPSFGQLKMKNPPASLSSSGGLSECRFKIEFLNLDHPNTKKHT
jgi:hypothetical protein